MRYISVISRKEVKVQINELLKNTPDSVLNEVLEYLKTVKSSSHTSINLSQNLKRILKEDKELLKRLAE